MTLDKLKQQLDFIQEIDKLKSVMRQSRIIGGARCENSAEHSWHLAVMALVLQEYADAETDMGKVIRMVLIHDIVEIDAGDTYAYDEKGNEDKAERERRAAERLFHLLPADQAEEMKSLWEEFEEGVTPEARFALALDRLQPLLLNFSNEGSSWKLHQVRKDQVMKRIRALKDASPVLHQFAVQLLDEAERRQYFTPK